MKVVLIQPLIWSPGIIRTWSLWEPWKRPSHVPSGRRLTGWQHQLPASELHPYCHSEATRPTGCSQQMAGILSRPATRRHRAPLTSHLGLNTPLGSLSELYCRLRCFHQPSPLSSTFTQGQTDTTGWMLPQPPPAPPAPSPFFLILTGICFSEDTAHTSSPRSGPRRKR